MPLQIDPITTAKTQDSLNGNSTPSSHSDSKFEEQLKTEEERLKSKTLLFAPGGQLAALFSSFSYNYDESLTLSKIEQEFDQQKGHTPQTQYQETKSQAAKAEEAKTIALPPPENSYKIDPKSFHEMISRSLGIFNFAPAFMPLQESPVFITKSQLQAIIDEITEQITLVKNNKKTELLLSLKPEQLGEMLLKVSNKNGMVTIQITSNEETKKLLDLNLADLKNSLENSELKIGEISVSVGNSKQFSRSPNLFSDISDFSQTLVENNLQNVLNLVGTGDYLRRLDLVSHLIDWEA